MSAYLIANVDVHDPGGYDAYRSQTGAIVARYGGQFIVRGGEVQVLEGEPDAHRLVIIQFENVGAARAFYDSAEYQAVIPLRTKASNGTFLIVEGAEG